MPGVGALRRPQARHAGGNHDFFVEATPRHPSPSRRPFPPVCRRPAFAPGIAPRRGRRLPQSTARPWRGLSRCRSMCSWPLVRAPLSRRRLDRKWTRNSWAFEKTWHPLGGGCQFVLYPLGINDLRGTSS